MHRAGSWTGSEFFIFAFVTRRLRVFLHRKEIRQLERAGINTTAADELLARMLVKIDELCAERDRLVGLDRRKYPGTNKFINGPAERRYR
jgi:hypothetical protein